MEKKSTNPDSIQAHLYSLMIPNEILDVFEIDSIIEKEDDLFINLIEKQSCIPTTFLSLTPSGFLIGRQSRIPKGLLMSSTTL